MENLVFKKVIIGSIVIASAWMVSSCTPTIYKGYSGVKSSTSKDVIMHTPVISDIDVKQEKIQGTFVDNLGSSEEKLKENAIGDALRKANADVLIEPKFEIIMTDTKVTTNVTGFPGYYVNFRKADTTSIALVQKGLNVVNNVVTPTNNSVFSQMNDQKAKQDSSKKTGITILVVVGVIAVLSIIIAIAASL